MPDQYRIDAGGKVESRLDDNGFLRVSGTVAKVGVYHYRNSDGTTRAELVTAECLQDAAANQTLVGAPTTVGHPAEGMVNAHTARIYAKGSVSGVPQFDNGELKVDTVFTHSDAIDAIDKRGMRQLSPGYKVDLDFTPGVFNGERYDCQQVRRYYNHLALVSEARGGKDCRLNLDGFDFAIAVDADHFNIDENEDKRMATVKLPNGVTVEVGDASTATAIQEAFRADAADKEKLKTDMDDAKKKYDELKGKYDALEDDAKKDKKDEDKEETEKRVDSMLSIIDAAKKLKSDIDYRNDGKLKSEREIMCDALGNKFDGQSDIYVKARFDAAVELAEKNTKDDKLRSQRRVDEKGAPVLSATEQHRQKFYKGEA